MLVDKSILKNLIRDVGEEVFGTLMQIYIDDTKNTISKLNNIIESQNFEGFALETHTLKSVSATYGAADAAELATELNNRCKNKESMDSMFDDGKKLVEVLENTLHEFEKIQLQDL